MNKSVTKHNDLAADHAVEEGSTQLVSHAQAASESKSAVDNNNHHSGPRNRPSRWPVWLSIAIVFALFTNWIVPRISVVFDLVGNFQLQLVLIAIVLAAIQLWRRRWFSGSMILMMVAWPAFTLAAFYIPTTQPESVTRTIRFMTYNVFVSSGQYQKTLDMIEDVDPDVFGLMEFGNDWFDAFEGKLQKYPYRAGPFLGNIIYSKIPFNRQTEKKHFVEPRLTPGSFAVFKVDDQQVYFLLVHATSPKTPARLVERDSQILGLQTTLSRASVFWHVVVAGDFNTTTHSYALDTMLKTSGLRDSRKGFGLQNSWPTWFWPMSVCIDHCFVSRFVRVEGRRVGLKIGSDHLPIIVDLSFGEHPRTRKKSASK